MLKKWLPTIISFVIGCGICIGISIWQCSFITDEYPGREGVYTGVSNGFFAGAVIYLCLGLFSVVGNLGAFNGLRYFGRVIRAKFARNETDRIVESYYDFVKKLEAKGKLSPRFLLIPGVIYIATAAVFTILYLNI